MTAASPVDVELAEFVAQFYANPLGFAKACFPWGEPHTPLADEPGPDPIQTQILQDLGREVAKRRFDGQAPVAPILMAASSGHGTGKSTLGGMIACWILSTRPYSIGTVTANTYPQLESRTWAAIQKWMRMSITAHWFHIRASGIYSRTSPEDWKAVAQTCKEENAQSFAGQHARTSTSWYMYDEASHIPDGIWDVAQGGLTDGEPMWFAWGQPARKSGRFFEICFGRHRDRWNVRCIDSRSSRFTNKATIDQWIADYGEDSDFVRVRVKGIAPRAGDLQFIDQDRVDAAKVRAAASFPDDPLIAGFDVSGGGQAWNIVWFRRGLDARSIPPIAIPGEHSQERSAILAKLTEILTDRRPGHRVSMMFVDSAYGAPYVERLRTRFDNIQEVNFGAPSPDRHQANMRAYMWERMKTWLERGAIPADDVVLETDLTAPGSHLNRSDQLVIEPKDAMAKRGVASPDRGDALCFVAGTLVETARGRVPIEQIKRGDLIVTPFGNSPVMILHEHDAERLTSVRFSNGASLTGTPNHEVFTFDSGPSRLDALTLTNEVDVSSIGRRALWRLVSLSFIGARSFGFKQQAFTFNPGARMHRSDFFIAGCGLTLTVLFQKATTFITRMTTGLIPSCTTLSFANASLTTGSTCSSEPRNTGNSFCNGSPEAESGPLNGTDLRKESNGIRSTASEPGRIVSRSMQSAHDVEHTTRRSSLPVLCFVRGLASKRLTGLLGDISRIPERALSAVKSFTRTAIEQPAVVLGCAQTASALPMSPISAPARSVARGFLASLGAKRRPVVPVDVRGVKVSPTRTYNLTLAEHNAYYANGILVFNCLTFAAHVPPVSADEREGERFRGSAGSWMA